ncbi:MAG: methyltransferase [Polyangiaceae bacterium]|nr:methyltransferase [Polyangiaceae bacterium]
MAPLPEPSADHLFGGALRLEQPPRGAGYRANVDALLLSRAALLERGAGRRTLDLGAGVGTVGLSYALFSTTPAASLVLVERDPLAAALARQNAAPFPFASVLELDVEHAHERAELVLCNPPFTDPSAGRPSAAPSRDAARRGPLAPFLHAAARSLEGPDARALFIFPAERLPGLLQGAALAGLSAASLRFVHPRHGAPARVVIAGFAAAAPPHTPVHPPWFEWEGAAREPALAAFLEGIGEPALPARSAQRRSVPALAARSAQRPEVR